MWLLTAILTVLFLGTALTMHGFERTAATRITRPLSQLPPSIGRWQVIQEQTMQSNVADVLQVDDYVWRMYQDSDSNLLNVYVSYFRYLDRNKGYHSPLNCMPGSGWGIAETRPLTITSSASGQQWTVNKTILQKGEHTQVMLYWYQGRGRVMNNEYMERIYRVWDSILLGRTDGAFVRLISMRSDGGVQAATHDLQDVAARLIPTLWNYLPNREASS